MNVFDLSSTLSLDAKGFYNGLDEAAGKAKSFASVVGKGIVNAAKIGGAAISATSAAALGFGKDAVKTGMDFDKSIAQVAATMGKTVEEVQDLRDFAKQMGSETVFSATQSADALNYMALAGYDASESMEMLPNVLDLAASGAMDLATASDMVTDAQSALGLSALQTKEMVDQMAKGASTTNTSVSQLGEAILTIGATAKNVKGGTAELTQVLGLLADNGIKGAEGGTKLRNIITKLISPTKDGAAVLDSFGVSLYDAEGNMRSMQDVFEDLNSAMEGFTQEQRDKAMSDLFNTRDLAAVNALLNTSTERWNEVSDAIGNAEGAAKKMAETQLDNLAGDVTILKSAYEGLQISVSDLLSDGIRPFVQEATDMISQLSDAANEGGFEGLIDKASEIIPQILNEINNKLPELLSIGNQIITSIISGAEANIGDAANVASNLTGILVTSMGENIPSLINIGTDIIMAIVNSVSENAEIIAIAGGSIITTLLDSMNTFVNEGGAEGIYNVIISILNTFLNNMDSWIITGQQILSGLLQGMSDNADAIIDPVMSIITSITEFIVDNIQPVIDTGLTIIESLAQGIIDNLPTLLERIPELIESLTNTFSEHLPEFIDVAIELIQTLTDALTDGNNLKTLINSALVIIDSVVTELIRLAPELLDAALEIILALTQGLIDSIPEIIARLPEIIDAILNFITESMPKIIDAGFKLFTSLIENLPEIIESIVAALPEIIDSIISTLVELTPMIISAGFELLIALVSDLPSIIIEIVKAIPDIVKGLTDAISNNIDKIVKAGFELLIQLVADVPRAVVEIVKAIPQIITGIVDAIGNLAYQIVDVGGNLVEGLWQGISGAAGWLWDQVSGWLNDLWDGIKDFFGIHSPSTEMAWIGQMLVAGLSEGIDRYGDSSVEAIGAVCADMLGATEILDTSIESVVDNMGDSMVDAINGIQEKAKGAGIGLMKSLADGIEEGKSSSKIELNSTIGNIVGNIGNSINKKENKPSDNKQFVLDAINALFYDTEELSKQVKTTMPQSQLQSLYIAARNQLEEAMRLSLYMGIDSSDKYENVLSSFSNTPSNLSAKIRQYVDSSIRTDAQTEDEMESMIDRMMGGGEFGDVLGEYYGNMISRYKSAKGGTNITNNITINSPTALDPAEVARQTANAMRGTALSNRGL